MINIDGSEGEGGGSILRLASALALIKQEKIKINNIRKKRANPGLRPQHLHGLLALTDLCGGELKGGTVGSNSIIFIPNNSWKPTINISIPTAGSIGLVLQILQIGMLASKNHEVEILIDGGATFGKWAPSIPYIEHVTWEIFRRMGYPLNIDVLKQGFYPRGGAKVKTTMKSPTQLNGIHLKVNQNSNSAKVVSIASTHLKKARVAERQGKKIQNELKRSSIESTLELSYVNTQNPGSGVLIYSSMENTVLASDSTGERRKSAEEVGLSAVKRYLSTLKSGNSTDIYLADQLIPIMALADSPSIFSTPKITNHTQTNINLLKRLNDTEITIEKRKTGYQLIIDV
ncbi:MAG: RNA 3'-terminal phosphate cyclase [Candidatus Hodarchaeales archaeon]|jgi:RNA 3'-terminal phosphate cyclase (ATP)/RNA 3'-terminal phosphate cyclase (GTP)